MAQPEVGIKITADGRAVVVAVKQAEDALQSLGTQVNQVGGAMQSAGRSSEGLEAAIQQAGKASADASGGLIAVSEAVKSAGDGLGALAAVSEQAAQASEGLSSGLGGQVSALDMATDALWRERAAQMGVSQEAARLTLRLDGQTAAQQAAARAALAGAQAQLDWDRIVRGNRTAAERLADELRELEQAGRRLGRSSEEIARQQARVQAAFDASERAAGGASAGLARLVSASGLVSTAMGTALVAKLVSVQREFDVLNASMVTMTGSSAAAQREMAWIEKFAAITPYGLSEVTSAFVKMKAMGLDPSQAALTSYGNTASAMGKNLDQMVEAVADAATGEFERLKEFGIKASVEGKNVAFTFQGVTTQLGNNAGEITDYLKRIGDVNFAGAMEERAKTLDGAISNLGDGWDKLFRTVNEAGVGNAMAESVRAASAALGDASAIIESLNSGVRDNTRDTGFLVSAQSALATVFETIAVMGANVKFVLVQIGSELGGLAAQAASVATGQFAQAGEIGRLMKADAQAARKEIDATTDRILNARKVAALGVPNSYDEPAVVRARAAAAKAEADAKAKIQADERKARDAAAGGVKALGEAARELERQRGLLGELAGLSSNFYTDWEALNRQFKTGTLNAAQLTAEHEKLLAKQPIIRKAREDELKVMQAQFAEQQAITDEINQAAVAASQAREQGRLSIDAYAQGIQESNAAIEFELTLMGKTAVERQVALADYAIELALKKQIAEIDRNAGFDEAQRAEERARAQDAASQAKVGARMQAEGQAHIDMWKSIDSTAQDVFTNVFDNGADTFKRLGKTLKASLLDLLYQMTIKRWIVNISGVVGGGGTMGSVANAATGEGGGGLLGTASSLNNLFGNGGVMGSVLGSGAAYGAAIGTTSIGVGSQAAMLAAQTQGFGAAGLALTGQAAGTAAGSAMAGLAAAGPYIAAALVLAAVLSKKTPGRQHEGGIYSTAGTDARTVATSLTGDAGEHDMLTRQNAGLMDFVKTTVDTTMAAATAKAKLLGMDIALGMNAGFTANLNGQGAQKNSFGQAQIFVDGKMVDSFVDNRMDGDPTKGAEEFTAKLQEMTAKAVLAGTAFGRTGETSMQTLDRLAVSLTSVNGVFDTLGTTLYATSLAGADVASKLVEAFGGMEAFAGATASYYETFYSERERTETGLRQLSGTLGKLGLALPDAAAEDALAQYRALTEAQNLNTDAGRTAYAALVTLSGQFAGVVQGTKELNAGLKTLAAEQKSLEIDLLEAQGNVAEATRMRLRMETLGMTEAEASAYRYNAALKAQIQAVKETTAANQGLQNQIDILTGKETERSIALRDAGDASTRALMRVVNGLNDVASAAAKAASASAAAAAAATVAATARTVVPATGGVTGAVNADRLRANAMSGLASLGVAGATLSRDFAAFNVAQNSGDLARATAALTPALASLASLNTMAQANAASFPEAVQKGIAAAASTAVAAVAAQMATPSDAGFALVTSSINALTAAVAGAVPTAEQIAAALALANTNQGILDATGLANGTLTQRDILLRNAIDESTRTLLRAQFAAEDAANARNTTTTTPAVAAVVATLDEVKSRLLGINTSIARASFTSFELALAEIQDRANEAARAFGSMAPEIVALATAERTLLNLRNVATARATVTGLNTEVARLGMTPMERELAGISDRAAEYLRGLTDIGQATPANIAAVNAWAAAMRNSALATEAAAAAAVQTNTRLGLERQLLELQSNTAALRTLEIAGMDAANVALYDRVQGLTKANALAQTNKGLQDRLDVLTGAQTERTIALRDATDESTRAIMRQIYAQEDLNTAMDAAVTQSDDALAGIQKALEDQRTARTKAVEDVKAVFDTISEAIKSLYGEVESTRAMQAAEGRAFIATAAALAKAGGVLPERDKLSEAIASARADTTVFASQADADFEKLVLAGQLQALADLAGPQLTEAQALLAATTDAYEVAKTQLDTLRGIDNSVLSVAEAVEAFQVAFTGEQTARQRLAASMAQAGAAGGALPGRDQATADSDPANIAASKGWAASRIDNLVSYASFGGNIDIGRVSAEIASLQQYIVSGTTQNLPSFDIGTNYVPRDMTANIHEGEMIVPKAYNPAANPGMRGNTERLERLVEGLTAEVQRLMSEGNRNTRRAADTLDNVTDGGNQIRMVAA